jgi:hypothetical protein
MLSRGRAFVYVLACRDDTLFKIGFCRDPIERWRTLHPRFFEFFDLDRGALIATNRVSEARRIERELLDAFAIHQAFAPAVIPFSAAGHTEWFRGVLDDVMQVTEGAARREGLVLHRPPSAWLRSSLLMRKDLLYAWSGRVLEAIEYERYNASDERGRAMYERALGDALDLLHAVHLDFSSWVPPEVMRWHVTWTARRLGKPDTDQTG